VTDRAPSVVAPPVADEPALIIAPSLLAADFARLGEEAEAVAADADWLHIDVMDYHYVPNLTIGLPVVQSLRKASALPFDCHLMIDAPERWAIGYAEAGAHNVTFHIEAAADPVGLARDLRAAGTRAGLAIDRDTPVEPYLEILPYFDTLLIMTIKAGFGGQQFMPELLDKVRAARRHVNAGHLDLRLEVDGGIDERSIVQATEAGADTFVAGTAVYGAADPGAAIRSLRRTAERASAVPATGGAIDGEGDATGRGGAIDGGATGGGRMTGGASRADA
jgi:ribulose-phosphate 3-epimerase